MRKSKILNNETLNLSVKYDEDNECHNLRLYIGESGNDFMVSTQVVNCNSENFREKYFELQNIMNIYLRPDFCGLPLQQRIEILIKEGKI